MIRQDTAHVWSRKRGLTLAGVMVLLGIALVWAGSGESQELADRQQAFLSAGQAYDSGQLEQALDLYEDIVTRGHIAPELFFNIGNVYYRLGDPARAILNYRRAWYLSPRDPDILANIQLAQNAAGALASPIGPRAAFATRLTLSAWVLLASAMYWLAFASLSLSLFLSRWRPACLRAFLLLSLLAVLSLWCASYWKDLERRPEAVVLEEHQKALFAPLPASTAHFEIPGGSLVRVEDVQGEWMQIRADNKSGWVKRSVCETVSPWQSAPVR